MSKSSLAALSLVAAVCCPGAASAQVAGGTLTGVITDAAGSAVAGAFVQMKNAERRLNFMVITQEQGKYSIDKLPAGKYVVQAIGGEHQSGPSNPVEVTVGKASSIDLSLTVARTPALPPAWPGRSPGERGAEAAAAVGGGPSLAEGEGKAIIEAKCTAVIEQGVLPGIERVGFLHAPPSAPKDFLQRVDAAAASHGLKLVPVVLPLPRSGEPTLETTIAQFAAEPNGGLVVMPSFITALVRARIIRAAAQYRAPAIYGHRLFATEGGLISYGTDIAQSFAQAASYIDRILKGETPAGLPLQPPSRYDLVLNLKTAKAMGLDVPVNVLALADEVIE